MTEETLTKKPVILVVAHPDDETIAAGGLLPRMLDPLIVYVTDGAPERMDDARAAGFERREDYAEARRTELSNALELAGIGEERLRFLQIADQEAAFHMATIARRLQELLADSRPAVVLTHAYEGGHPDHDSTALAVHAACARLAPAPQIWEFAGYHSRNGSLVAGEFLIGEEPGQGIVLKDEARERKRRMFDCYGTQQHMLRNFPIDVERFRPAPLYDFSQPPHAGALWYEQFGWNVDGKRWRELAAAALRELGLGASA